MDINELQYSTLTDENGVPIIYAKECLSFPDEISFPIEKKEDLSKISNLVSQSMQGVINTSGRTIELVFKPEIQKGLKDGSLRMMQTKTGEVLADAVHSSGSKIGRVAGKGRILEAGKLKQLATGSFQLMSLIVAQAHLADINKNLTDIKLAVNNLIDKIDSHNAAEVEGRIDYLQGIIEKMQRGDFDYEMSLQIKVKIEGIVADAFVLQAKLLTDLKNIKNEVARLTNLDTFGTGDTYQKLKEISEQLPPLITRRNVFLKMASLLAYIQACIDPLSKNFSQFDLKKEVWNTGLSELIEIIATKANELLSKAKFNSDEILSLRRSFILNSLELINNNATNNYEQFENSLIKLKNNHQKVLSQNGKLRLVVSHDDSGQIQRAAVVD
ncbi:hypothetical protein [Proteus vulgaris]|uniref:hypothetical protein n=1 Tax=Proteus vulgaris TaxID=585 RepID=UPI0034D56849